MSGFEFSQGMLLALFLFGLFLLILWIVLPFAIFGTKPRLDRLIAEQKRTNELLAQDAADRKRAIFERETARPDGRREPAP